MITIISMNADSHFSMILNGNDKWGQMAAAQFALDTNAVGTVGLFV